MSLSYNCIFPRRTVTLLSVEMWGTNMNIVKQPYRSIHTRRIDKVGDTNAILEMHANSMDRIAENIQQYARGVNPSKVYEKIQPKTTYKLQLDGAFRAPQLNSGNITSTFSSSDIYIYCIYKSSISQLYITTNM